jgi:hypothetical protein
MSLATTIDKVIVLIKADTNLKGVYWGDQLAFSDYPVACVGIDIPNPSDNRLSEDFPVIAAQKIREEIYKIGVVIYVRYEETEANAKQVITLTDTMRKNLRANLNLDGYILMGEIGDTNFYIGAKTGDILVRLSITRISYTKRIHD